MSTYLLSAAGVIFLSVIISLIIPEGKLNKTITFFMRLVCIFVLIQPLTGIFKSVGVENGEVATADYAYVSAVYSEHQSTQLQALLNKEFNAETSCSVQIEYVDGEFKATATEVRVENSAEDKQITAMEIEDYLLELGYKNVTVIY